jgi:hypothetical protein
VTSAVALDADSGSVGARRKIQMSQATWLVMRAGMLMPIARSSPQ